MKLKILQTHCRGNGKAIGKGGPSSYTYWIGLNQTPTQHEWTTGEILTDSNWEDGNPESYSNNKHCTTIEGSTGKWMSVDCSESHFILCEISGMYHFYKVK